VALNDGKQNAIQFSFRKGDNNFIERGLVFVRINNRYQKGISGNVAFVIVNSGVASEEHTEGMYMKAASMKEDGGSWFTAPGETEKPDAWGRASITLRNIRIKDLNFVNSDGTTLSLIKNSPPTRSENGPTTSRNDGSREVAVTKPIEKGKHQYPWSPWVNLNDGKQNAIQFSFRKGDNNFIERGMVFVRIYNRYQQPISGNISFVILNQGVTSKDQSEGVHMKAATLKEDGGSWYLAPGETEKPADWGRAAISLRNIRMIGLSFVDGDNGGPKFASEKRSEGQKPVAASKPVNQNPPSDVPDQNGRAAAPRSGSYQNNAAVNRSPSASSEAETDRQILELTERMTAAMERIDPSNPDRALSDIKNIIRQIARVLGQSGNGDRMTAELSQLLNSIANSDDLGVIMRNLQRLMELLERNP